MCVLEKAFGDFFGGKGPGSVIILFKLKINFNIFKIKVRN